MRNTTQLMLDSARRMGSDLKHSLHEFSNDGLFKNVIDLGGALALTIYVPTIAEGMAAMNFVAPGTPKIIQVTIGITAFAGMVWLGANAAEFVVLLATLELSKFTRTYIAHWKRRRSE